MQGGGAIVIPIRDGFLDKLHLTSTTTEASCSTIDSSRDVTTTANIPDNKMYVPLTSSSSSSSPSSSSVFSLPSLCYMTADPQDMMTRNCMSIAKVLKIDLVCPIKRYEKIPRRGSSLCFYESVLEQTIYTSEGNIHRTSDRAYKISTFCIIRNNLHLPV